MQNTYSWTNNRAGIIYEDVNLKFGYSIFSDKSYWIYPSLGAGISSLVLTDYQIDGDLLNTKSETSPHLSFALNNDFLLSKNKWKDKYYLGWILGISLGYNQSFAESWKNNSDYKFDAVPPITNNAFFLKISVGGAALEKK